jgi:hypothetical protein
MKFSIMPHSGSVYNVRELVMPDGTAWAVARETDMTALEDVDDKIGFYFKDEVFLKASDEELMEIIGDCT